MKLRITRLIMVAAIAAMVGIAGSTVAWADEVRRRHVPLRSSPNYSPDFSNVANQACLTPNNNGDTGCPLIAAASTGIEPSNTSAGGEDGVRLTPNATFQSGSAWFDNRAAGCRCFFHHVLV